MPHLGCVWCHCQWPNIPSILSFSSWLLSIRSLWDGYNVSRWHRCGGICPSRKTHRVEGWGKREAEYRWVTFSKMGPSNLGCLLGLCTYSETWASQMSPGRGGLSPLSRKKGSPSHCLFPDWPQSHFWSVGFLPLSFCRAGVYRSAEAYPRPRGREQAVSSSLRVISR